MAIFTISGFLAAIGAGITAVASAAGFLANIATIPFKIAGDNKSLAIVMYWVVFAVDTFVVVPLVSGILQPFFDIFGLEGIQLGFTTIYLTVINIFTGFIFGWFFVPMHLLMLASVLLIFEFVAFMLRTKSVATILSGS